MKVRKNLLTQRLTPERANFKEDATTVTEDLESFSSRVSAGNRAYKYPNVELKRCYDAKNFKESNSMVHRMLSTRGT